MEEFDEDDVNEIKEKEQTQEQEDVEVGKEQEDVETGDVPPKVTMEMESMISSELNAETKNK